MLKTEKTTKQRTTLSIYSEDKVIFDNCQTKFVENLKVKPLACFTSDELPSVEINGSEFFHFLLLFYIRHCEKSQKIHKSNCEDCI